MRFIHLTIFALLSLIGYACSQGIQCGTKVCPQDNNLCCSDVLLGPTCYDPTVYSCVDNKKVCANQDGLCVNNICYNSTIYWCLFNGASEYLCPQGNVGCGVSNTCYDPTMFTCQNGKVAERTSLTCGTGTCTATQACCNGVCYDPTADICAVADGVVGQVCPLNDKGKANGVCNVESGPSCYDRDTQTCINAKGSLVICMLNDSTCVAAASQTSSPASSSSGSSMNTTSGTSNGGNETVSTTHLSSIVGAVTQGSSASIVFLQFTLLVLFTTLLI